MIIKTLGSVNHHWDFLTAGSPHPLQVAASSRKVEAEEIMKNEMKIKIE